MSHFDRLTWRMIGFGLAVVATLLSLALSALPIGVRPAKAETTPESFVDDFDVLDTGVWHLAHWGNPLPPFLNFWRPDHAVFADGTLRIHLDAEPCPEGCDGRPVAAAEIRSNDLFGYGRFDARLKASDEPGTVTAFFLYTSHEDDNPLAEIDVEILGDDPTRMQANYYAGDSTPHATWIDLGFDASQGFHTYSMDWRHGRIRWYVDGILRHTEDGTRGPLPSTPARIMLSHWACTGIPSWCSTFGSPSQTSSAEFDWVRYTSPWRAYLPLITASNQPTATPNNCRLIDDFEDIGDWQGLQGNGATCTFTPQPGYQGQGLRISCIISDSNGWFFAFKRINEDWRLLDGLRFWYRKGTVSNNIYVGLKDADGEIYHAPVTRDHGDWEQVYLPRQALFGPDRWDHQGNQILDLQSVQQFRFRHWPQRVGPVTVTVDNLEVCFGPRPTETPGPEPSPTDTPTPTATGTLTWTPSATATWTPSATATWTPSATATWTATWTPSPTSTWTPSPTATPTRTPSPTPLPTWPENLVEDFEQGIAAWVNPYNDLDVFTTSNSACHGSQALRIGGTDEDEGNTTWIGQALLLDWQSRPRDWRSRAFLSLCLKRGETWRGGRPSVTVFIVDGNGYNIALHRDEDDPNTLPWIGGGYRTIVENQAWQTYTYPLRFEPDFAWDNVAKLRIELRRTISMPSMIRDPQPDDLYVDYIRLN